MMFPEWLRAKKPSPNAYVAYVTLGSFGTFNPRTGCYDECRPSMARMCEESGLSESVMKRAILELIKIGGARRRLRFKADGSPAPSSYELVFGEVREPSPNSADLGGAASGPTWGQERAQVGPSADPNQEPSTNNPLPKTGMSTSCHGSQLENESASPQTRRRREKPIRDPKVRNEAADDSEAVLVANEVLSEDQDPNLLVKFLRRDRNASTTAGHMRHISQGGGAGIVEMYSTAETWDENLDEEQAQIASNLIGKMGLTGGDAALVAQHIREALEIRCTREAINAATRRLAGSPVGEWFGAIDVVVKRREAERKQERINRVRQQQETAA